MVYELNIELNMLFSITGKGKATYFGEQMFVGYLYSFVQS